MRPQPDFIHEFISGSSNRTLLLLHGTGGNERDLIPLGRELDPTAALLSPRGKVLENGMPRFCFARWCRLFLISSPNFPPCVYGLAQEQTTRSFPHQRPSVSLNFCAARERMSRFAISQSATN